MSMYHLGYYNKFVCPPPLQRKGGGHIALDITIRTSIRYCIPHLVQQMTQEHYFSTEASNLVGG